MPQVAPAAIKDRAERLRASAGRRRAAWLASLTGSAQDVLVERPGTRGHAGNFAEVLLDAPAEPGTIVSARITAATDTHLLGTIS